MKNLKIYGILAMLLLCAGFVSCSDDDKDEPEAETGVGNSGNNSDLIGMWDLVYEEGYETGNDGTTYMWDNEVENETRLELLDNGTMKQYEYYNNGWEMVNLVLTAFKAIKLWWYFLTEIMKVIQYAR